MALLEGERLVEVHVDGRRRSQVGDIYLGRVERLVPAIDAAFVDIGQQRNAFLHADDFALAPGEGLRLHQPVVVQVLRDQVPGKGPRIRRGASLPGRYLVLLAPGDGAAVSARIEEVPERERLAAALDFADSAGVGWIARTAAAGVDADELSAEAATLLATWRAIEKVAATEKPPLLLHGEVDSIERWLRDRFDDSIREIWVDSEELAARIRAALERLEPQLVNRLHLQAGRPSLFENFNVERQLAELWNPRVALPAGGSLVVQPTEALVAIDVNSGSDLGASSLEQTALATNLEAAREVARQIRLRDLAGIIVVDFIDMISPGSWDEVRGVLEAALAQDRATTMVEGPVAFGLMAITRKRGRHDLLRRLSVECPACQGRGRLLSPIEIAAAARRALLAHEEARPGRRWRLRLHPSIAVEIEIDAAALLDSLARDMGDRWSIETAETLGLDEFEIVEVTQ
jgi:ribonuclease G